MYPPRHPHIVIHNLPIFVLDPEMGSRLSKANGRKIIKKSIDSPPARTYGNVLFIQIFLDISFVQNKNRIKGIEISR